MRVPGRPTTQNIPINAKRATSVRKVTLITATMRNALPANRWFMTRLARLPSPEVSKCKSLEADKVSCKSPEADSSRTHQCVARAAVFSDGSELRVAPGARCLLFPDATYLLCGNE